MFDIRKYAFAYIFYLYLIVSKKKYSIFSFQFCLHSLVLFFEMYYYNTKQCALPQYSRRGNRI